MEDRKQGAGLSSGTSAAVHKANWLLLCVFRELGLTWKTSHMAIVLVIRILYFPFED